MFLLGSDGGMTFTAIGRILGDLSSASIGRIYKKLALEFKAGGKTRKDISAIRKKYEA